MSAGRPALLPIDEHEIPEQDFSLPEKIGIAVMIALIFLFSFTGCARRQPVVTYAGCGKLPVEVLLCLDTLPPSATDADYARCAPADIRTLAGEAAALREQFKPCAR